LDELDVDGAHATPSEAIWVNVKARVDADANQFLLLREKVVKHHFESFQNNSSAISPCPGKVLTTSKSKSLG